jgi:hypothetical protein
MPSHGSSAPADAKRPNSDSIEPGGTASMTCFFLHPAKSSARKAAPSLKSWAEGINCPDNFEESVIGVFGEPFIVFKMLLGFERSKVYWTDFMRSRKISLKYYFLSPKILSILFATMTKAFKTFSGVFFLLLAATGPFLPFVAEKLSFFTCHALTGLMPIKHQIARTFLNGEYPLWNPFMLCGVPFHSGIGIADPLLLSYFFLDGVPALLLSAYFAFCVAGIGMFFYLRRGWDLSVSASLVGGILYALNPFFGATCHETPFMAPPVYLPLVFLFYEISVRTWRFSQALLSGFFLSLVFFSGNLQSFFLAVLFFLMLQISRSFLEASRGRLTLLKRMLWLAIPVLFSLLVAAIDLLPTWDALKESSRAVNQNPTQQICFFAAILFLALIFLKVDWRKRLGTAFQAVRWTVSLGILAAFLLKIDWAKGFFGIAPNLFFPDIQKLMLHGRDAFDLLQAGSGVPGALLRNFIEPRFIFYIQPPVYLFALTTLFLFALGFLKTKDRVLKAWGWCAILMAIFPFTFIPNVFHYIFHFDLLAYPRFMFAFFFVLAVIAAYGFHAMTGPSPLLSWKKHPMPLLAGFGTCLLGLGCCFFLFRGQFDPLAFQLTLENFTSAGMALHNWFLRSWLYQVLCVDSFRFFLKGEPWLLGFCIAKYAALALLFMLLFRPGRLRRAFFLLAFAFEMIASWNFYVFQKDDVRAVTQNFQETRFLQVLPLAERVAIRNDPSVSIMNFYEKRRAFDWAGNLPLFWNAHTIEGSALNLSPKLFSKFWSIEQKNLYTPTELRVPHSAIYDLMGMNYLFSDLPLQEDAYVEVSRLDRYRVYKNAKALPPFYLANDTKAVSFETARELILSGKWDPREQTLIENDVPAKHFGNVEFPKGEISVQRSYSSRNHFAVGTASRRSELFATTRAFHKNWSVYVDGKPGRLEKINLYFLGVFLEPGDHEISFRYQPRAFQIGSFVSLTALFFLGIMLASEGFFFSRKERP